MAWRVAVFGTGGWSRVHLAALTRSQHVSKVVLVGRNAAALARLAAEFPVVESTSTDAPAVLADDSIEVVDIVLPHHLHVATTIAALEAGKHVICEKPAAMTLDDFDRACAACDAADRRLLVVMNQLFNPVNRRVRALVDAGDLGRPFLVAETAFSCHSHFYHDPHTWRTRLATAGGGVLIDGGYHMIYKQLDWLTRQGTPRWVTADAAQLAVDPSGRARVEQGEDFVAYTVGYDDPLRITSTHAWTLAADIPRGRQNLVAGSEATLEVTGDGSRPLVLHRADGHQVVDVPPGPNSNTETLEACLLEYLACLDEQRPPRYGSLASARRTLEVILAVYQSASTGQRIRLDG